MEEKEKEGLIQEIATKLLETLGFNKDEVEELDDKETVEEEVEAKDETEGMTDVEKLAYNKAKQKYEAIGIKSRIKAMGISGVNLEMLTDMIDAGASSEKIDSYIAKMEKTVPNKTTGASTMVQTNKTKSNVSAGEFGKLLHAQFGKKIKK